ncbi:YopT-type cysteine protease domain-containing protein [Zavarzinia sp.]|uniref:YopT-type cysteine protease domain-containing protein n=1 Tax=Zavarzinia sp. TaxID=2027920 RepID=UPI00356521F9
MKFVKFSQGDLLDERTTDRDLRNGICASLCDHWIRRIRSNPTESPEDRLATLKRVDVFADAMKYQQKYNAMRKTAGAVDSRKAMGQSLGLAIDADKTIVDMKIDDIGRIHTVDDMVRLIMRDIKGAMATASWSLRFVGGGGHAIAGASIEVSMMKAMKVGQISASRPLADQFTAKMPEVHIFDPNEGEFSGDAFEVTAMFTQLMRDYQVKHKMVVQEVRRYQMT